MVDLANIDFAHLSRLNTKELYDYVLTSSDSAYNKLLLAKCLEEAGIVTNMFVKSVEHILTEYQL